MRLTKIFLLKRNDYGQPDIYYLISDEAFDKVDKERLDFIIGNDYLRAEMLGLHFVRERITSTDRKIQVSDDLVINILMLLH